MSEDVMIHATMNRMDIMSHSSTIAEDYFTRAFEFLVDYDGSVSNAIELAKIASQHENTTMICTKLQEIRNALRK